MISQQLTIKNAKQHQIHRTLHSKSWGAGDNKISLLRSSINPTELYIPSLVFWSPPPSIVLEGEPETIK